MRPLSLRIPIAVLLAGATLACGGSEEPDPGEPAPPLADTTPTLAPAAPADTGDVTLLQPVPDGGPMPDADRTRGVPPYPGAIVHTRLPRNRPGILSFEAFTPDSLAEVERFYDASLGPRWAKTDAADTRVYERENDEAAITLSPWNPEDLPPGVDHPPVLREARTIIGVAWRSESAPPPEGG